MGKKKRMRHTAPGGISKSHQTSRKEKMENPRLKALILEVVEEQVRFNDPPETRQTYERLLATGHPHAQAVEMIGGALVEEIWEMLQEKKPFDRTRFALLLEQVR